MTRVVRLAGTASPARLHAARAALATFVDVGESLLDLALEPGPTIAATFSRDLTPAEVQQVRSAMLEALGAPLPAAASPEVLERLERIEATQAAHTELLTTIAAGVAQIVDALPGGKR